MRSRQVSWVLSSSKLANGFVLPVVLVMLVVMTTVVLFTMRRGTVDERLAANVRGLVTVDAAATYVLRYCELMLTLSPPGRTPDPGMPPPPRVILAPPQGDPPAWRAALNWDMNGMNPLANTIVWDRALLNQLGAPEDVSRAECLIEDASAELEVQSVSGPNVRNNAPELPAEFQKFRITVELEGPGPGGIRIARAQSELRM